MPVFGVIKEIFKIDSKYFFVYNVLNTLCFVSHMHAYEVNYSNIVEIVKIDLLYDYYPLGLYHSQLYNALFVSLKYHIVENLL